jgi:CheY-like chemotaxis protein
MASVLIVEDDPDIRALETMACQCSGYDTATASNGAAALRVLETAGEAPCLILLDLMMPVMDGLTFLEERHRRHLREDIPVVCLSAAGPDLLASALRLGADRCVAKPADFDELCALVDGYCGC